MSVDYVISEAHTTFDINEADIAVSKDGHVFKDRFGNAATVLAELAGPVAVAQEAKIKKLEDGQNALIEAFAAVINLLPENRRQMIIRELEKAVSI